MNQDRFEQLMYRAGLTAQGCWDELDSYARESIEEFGKLVAQECADLCDRFQDRAVGMQPTECAGAIRQMFGINNENP